MSEQFSSPAGNVIRAGKVIRAHGLKGDLKIVPFSHLQEHFSTHSRFALAADDGRMTKLLRSERTRVQGKLIILKLETIDTRDEAELTIGMDVLLCGDDLDTHDARMNPQRLQGLAVRVETTEHIIGTVVSCFNNGAHDIAVVRDGSREYLIPLVDDIVVSFDDRELVINPPPGLLEINTGADR
ncbi:MAG: ribosome maturation factor RimM [Desulfocapsaceae bacterium]|jgi:16S rRNA processing protein RimM|nr:ribosome maturation factor RimM [Desulfocapsaceae bacterium]